MYMIKTGLQMMSVYTNCTGDIKTKKYNDEHSKSVT